MPLYKYEVMDKQGKSLKSEINAENYDIALNKIKDMGFIVLDLSEKPVVKKNSLFTMTSGHKVTLTDLAIFSRQLSAMLSAGIPITRAIVTLSKQTQNKTLASALDSIAKNIESGMNLTDAFAKYPKIFNTLYLAMLKAGEVGGLLETTLMRLSNQLHKDKKLKDDIKAATSYPKMVGSFAFVIFLAMMVFLVPTFESYIPNPDKIPAMSAFVFGISKSIRTQYFIWILAFVVLVFLIYSFAKSKAGHDFWENIKLKIPVFGNIMLKVIIARFSRTLSTLVEGGIPIIQALRTAGPTSGSDLVAQVVDNAIVKIEEGQGIAEPFEESKLFPPMFTHMVAIGEESGTLSKMLDKIAEFYEEDVETASKSLSSILEPIILVVVALMVGGMLISLYLPIFTAVTQSAG